MGVDGIVNPVVNHYLLPSLQNMFETHLCYLFSYFGQNPRYLSILSSSSTLLQSYQLTCSSLGTSPCIIPYQVLTVHPEWSRIIREL